MRQVWKELDHDESGEISSHEFAVAFFPELEDDELAEADIPASPTLGPEDVETLRWVESPGPEDKEPTGEVGLPVPVRLQKLEATMAKLAEQQSSLQKSMDTLCSALLDRPGPMPGGQVDEAAAISAAR